MGFLPLLSGRNWKVRLPPVTTQKTLTCVVLYSSCVGKQKQSFKQFRSQGMMNYATDNLENNQAMDTVMLLAGKC